MAPRRKKSLPQHDIASWLMLPALGLIVVGDAVRASLRVTATALVAILRLLFILTRELYRASRSWMHEKIRTPRMRIRIPVLRLPPLRLPALRLPAVPVRLAQAPAQKTEQPTAKNDRIKAFVAGVALTALFFLIPYSGYQFLLSLPNPHLLSRRDLEVTTKIFDRNGALLYEIYADQNRTPLPLEEIPQVVKDATVAIEDQDFYRHSGISIRGIARALREILLNNRIQGGSTITQQLIKSALLTPEVKLSRKIKEVILAFWAERIYSKNQILEMYLNQVPYGGTAWGIGSAAQTYFGKSARDVTLAEAALLAGLPQAPTEYSPFGSNPQRAFERQEEVIRRMIEDRMITKEEGEIAITQEIQLIPPRIAIRAPHFVMYVKELLEQRYGARVVERGGLRITTSLDITLQEKAEDILRTQVESLSRLRVGNGGAVLTNPKTGEILAMVGSKNYFDLPGEGNVNVTTSHRQPGSSIKVVTYAAALERGFTAATVIDDSPVVYRTPGSPPYAPVNYRSITTASSTVPRRFATRLGTPTTSLRSKRWQRSGFPQ
jgi:membrane peptidoglycan carboxypeptidase